MRLGLPEESHQEALRQYKDNFPDQHPLEFFSFSIMPDEIEFTRAYNLGMIRKEDLVAGKYYKGNCRNASVAKWNGSKFDYMRYKWGSYYKDSLCYPTDEDHFDVFIPWAVVEPSEKEIIKGE